MHILEILPEHPSDITHSEDGNPAWDQTSSCNSLVHSYLAVCFENKFRYEDMRVDPHGFEEHLKMEVKVPDSS
ncbi:hypothetical protein Tco_1285908 [Tanacetum coccineum]